MSLKNQIAKKAVLDAALLGAKQKLMIQTSGNISTLTDPKEEIKQVAVTPTGIEYDKLTVDNIPIVNMQGEVIEGDMEPSSELKLHLEVYRRRPDVGAIVHTHSEYCTVYALAGKPIPAISEDMMLTVGADVGVAKYAPPGTQELAENVASALGEGKKAVLMANHGLVSVAPTLEEAMKIASVCERSAKAALFAAVLRSLD